MKSNHHVICHEQVSNVLVQEGFNQVKTGGFSKVYINPAKDVSYVYKIFKSDPHYLDFLQFCKDNPYNPFLPKFDNLIHFTHENFHVLRMEKLQVLTQEFGVEKAFRLSNQYEDILKSWEHLKHKNFNRHFKALLNQLFLLTKKGKLSDINTDNLMLRHKQIVFTDPIGY
jgi:hypothetical protein